MSKTKRNEVPKEYRRNYKKELVEWLLRIAICAVLVFVLAYLFLCV